MGNSQQKEYPLLSDVQPRNLYITCDGSGENSGSFGPYEVFTFTVSHGRYTWQIHKRYSEVKFLHGKLRALMAEHGLDIHAPKSHRKLFWKRHDSFTLQKRGDEMAKYLEYLGTFDLFWQNKYMLEFLEICKLSFLPELGRKGKCGYLKKVRGGMFSSWRWRLVIAHDSYVAVYIPGEDGVSPEDVPEEVLRVDPGFEFTINGRYVNMKSNSGSLALCTYTRRQALEWGRFLTAFYDVNVSPRVQKSPNELITFPSRCSLESIEAFHCSRNYFHSLAVQLLNATSDIFIASSELSPTVLLTRPPLPSLRLDQILRFKANQGVHIYIMINRECNPSRSSHNSTSTSFDVKAYLQGLSSNIRVIRVTKSPNIGYQNEKLIVVDRVVAFVGSIDINFGQFDDFAKSVVDQAGIMFPGSDYIQPCKIMKSAKRISPSKMPSGQANMPSSTQSQSQSLHSEGSRHGTFGPGSTYPVLSSVLEDMDGDASVMTLPQPLTLDQYAPNPSSQHSTADQQSYMSSHDTQELSSVPQSYSTAQQGVDDSITNRMTEMFADEELDEAELELRQSRSTNESMVASKLPKKASITDSIMNVLSNIGSGIEEAVTTFFHVEPFVDAREELPRQPWHGIHVCLKGLSARDLSSHFIQKWRYHKSNRTQIDACISFDITDGVYCSVCARCKFSNIFEDMTSCPNCALPLGPCSMYSDAGRGLLAKRRLPVPIDEYSYIEFECLFLSKMGCLLHGKGPVAIEHLVSSAIEMTPGRLLYEQGPYADVLKDRGLFPSVADIVLSVDYTFVTHMNFMEVKRFCKRQLAIKNEEGTLLSVTFRRHHIQSAVNIYKNFLERLSVVETSAASVHVAETAQVVSYEPTTFIKSELKSAAPTSTQMECNEQQLHVHVPSQIQPQQQTLQPLQTNIDPISGMRTHSAHTQYPQSVNMQITPDIHVNYEIQQEEKNQQIDTGSSTQQLDNPYAGFYPSLDIDSSSVTATPSQPQHRQEEQQWVSENQMWSPDVTVMQQDGRDERKQNEELSLEEYLQRYNVRGPSPLGEQKHEDNLNEKESGEKEEVNGNGMQDLVNGITTDHEIIDDKSNKKPEEAFDSDHTVQNIDLPPVPESIPPQMFPDAPTHDVHQISASASSRGILDNVDTENNTKRHKEISMSGRGANFSTTSYANNSSESPSFHSQPVGNYDYSYPPQSQQVDNGCNENQFWNDIAIPNAISISDKKDGTDNDSYAIQCFPFPPLYVPDNTFLPRQREHACNEAIEMDTNFAMSTVAHSLKSERPDSRDVFPFDLHHPVDAISAGPMCQVQVLRSISGWSAGAKTERSIHEAWISAIESSQHLIYIENSLFISDPQPSSQPGGNSRARSSSNLVNTCWNKISEALLTRLQTAANNRENFRVIFVLPQHASGDFCDSSRNPVLCKQMAMQWKGLKEMVEKFQKLCPNVMWSNYLGFFSLRNWGILNEKVVHSQVYVAASIIIADDRLAIIGSADANDQGMCGIQDSNVGIRVEDTTPISIQLGGRQYEASRFAHELRMNLMRHHIGDHDPFSKDLEDIALHDESQTSGGISVRNGYSDVWQRIAQRNEESYRLIDGEYSLYNIESLDILKKKNMKANYIHKSEHDSQVQHTLDAIQGFLVPFPLGFNVSY